MIDRPVPAAAIGRALASVPICLLVGARQTGKTTLARSFVPHGSERYFDLEDPVDLARLDEPMVALRDLDGLIVIDEVQRRPDLFPVLRVLVDRPDSQVQFLILGSASPSALRQSSESLAGRVEIVELDGFDLAEVGADRLDDLWLRGGYPRSFLAPDLEASTRWRSNYVRTLAGAELPDFGLGLPSETIQRFLAQVAHCHGQLWSGAPIARSLDIAESTTRKYVDALADAMLVRILRPWSSNIGKREVKSPKVYFRDSGLVHFLLGVDDRADLVRQTHVGATWEGLVIEHLISRRADMTPYFWRTSNGAELDLLLVRGERRVGYEIKRSDAPKITASMRSAMADLQLESLTVVYPGDRDYELGDRIHVRSVSSALTLERP